jgi:hypothetical protein
MVSDTHGALPSFFYSSLGYFACHLSLLHLSTAPHLRQPASQFHSSSTVHFHTAKIRHFHQLRLLILMVSDTHSALPSFFLLKFRILCLSALPVYYIQVTEGVNIQLFLTFLHYNTIYLFYTYNRFSYHHLHTNF